MLLPLLLPRESRSIRAVLDTNVLVSALLFGGRLHRIAEHIASGFLTPCFIDSTLQEFQVVIHREKFQPVFEREGLAVHDLVRAVMEQSMLFKDPQEIPGVLDDVPDNYLLACALAANASCIVSGDKTLCRLREFHRIPILTPAEFLQHSEE